MTDEAWVKVRELFQYRLCGIELTGEQALELIRLVVIRTRGCGRAEPYERPLNVYTFKQSEEG